MGELFISGIPLPIRSGAGVAVTREASTIITGIHWACLLGRKNGLFMMQEWSKNILDCENRANI